MPKTTFNFDNENMPFQAFTAWNVAGLLLIELVKAKGHGPWFDELKSDLVAQHRGQSPIEGYAAPKDMKAVQSASVAVVESIFDRIAVVE